MSVAGGVSERARARRSLRSSFVALVVLGAALVAAPAPAAASPSTGAAPAQAPTQYTNPVRTGLISNPFVVRSGTTYFAYTSGFDFFLPHYVMAMQSTDLVTWTNVGNVLTGPGAWADGSSGYKVTSPSVLNVPTNPAAQQWVMYYTAIQSGTQTKCIGLATASSPAGPFTPNAQPFICPPGGAQDPSPVPLWANPPYQQLVYKAGNTIYNQVLTADGLSLSPGNLHSLYTAKAGWWQQGVVDRPAVAASGNNYYLFFSGGQANTSGRAVGWTPCGNDFGVVRRCGNQTQLGPWMETMGDVVAPNGVQVFSDGANQWVVYDARPAGGCTPTTCTQNPSLHIDKLCFGHDQPRTNGPTTTAQLLARSPGCSTDIPGAALDVDLATDVVDDGTVVPLDLDGNVSAAAGGRSLWAFGDNFKCGNLTNWGTYGVPNAAATGPNYVQDTACPQTAMIPKTQAELDYDAAHASCTPPPGGSCEISRIVHWSGGLIGLPDGGAWVLFGKAINIGVVTASGIDWWHFEGLGIGAVRLTATEVANGVATASRSTSVSPVGCAGGGATAAGCLFDAHVDPDPESPLDEFSAPLVDGGYLYLYSAKADVQVVDGQLVVEFRSKVARAPLDQIDTPSAWRYWTGPGPNDWGMTYASAAEMPGMMAGNVAYNPYLDKFINIFQFIGGEFAQTATSPTGPWSAAPMIIDVGSKACGPSTDINYWPRTGAAHFELATRGQRTLAVSYFVPGFGSCPDQLRWATVKLD